MSVKNRYTYTLACDLRRICFYDLSIFNSAENTKRFLLALFFFSTNEWNDIFYISGQSLKVFPAPEIAW